MLTEDSTVLEHTQSSLALSIEDRSVGNESVFDESFIIPCNMESMSVESLELMVCELNERIRADELRLQEKREQQETAFESFDKLSFIQKYVRRNSKTRRGVSESIFLSSTEIAEMATNIQRMRDKLKVLDDLSKTMEMNANLKEKHKMWHEGQKHSLLGGTSQNLSKDQIFDIECRLSLCKLCFGLTTRHLGRYILSKRTILGPYETRSELYRSLTQQKQRLIYMAQACDEIRLEALPTEDSLAERHRVNRLTDSAYASEIFMLAGVAHWVITSEDEKNAAGICAYEEENRKRLQGKFSASIIDKENADSVLIGNIPPRREIAVNDLLNIHRDTFIDQIKVTNCDIRMMQKALDEQYKLYDEMSVSQKFLRPNSATKCIIGKEIYVRSLQIKLLWDELRYWKRQLLRLDEIIEACFNLLKPRTMKGLQQHGTFQRLLFDCLQDLPEDSYDGLPACAGFTTQELNDMISNYDYALNALDKVKHLSSHVQESTIPKLRVRSAISDDNAPLFLDEDENGCIGEDGVDIDEHISSIHYTDPPLDEAPGLPPSSGLQRDVEVAEDSLAAAQADLEKVPTEFVYHMYYLHICKYLDDMKQKRQKCGIEFGVAHINGKYVNHACKCELVNDVTHKLIEVARDCDEARIHALSESERHQEIFELMDSSESSYVSRILALADVLSWNISHWEEQQFIEEASVIEAKRQALSSDVLIPRNAPPLGQKNRISPI